MFDLPEFDVIAVPFVFLRDRETSFEARLRLRAWGVLDPEGAFVSSYPARGAYVLEVRRADVA
jgi:hypothetical protein